MTTTSAGKMLKQYACGGFRFSDKSSLDYHDRHLVFDHVDSLEIASQQ